MFSIQTLSVGMVFVGMFAGLQRFGVRNGAQSLGVLGFCESSN